MGSFHWLTDGIATTATRLDCFKVPIAQCQVPMNLQVAGESCLMWHHACPKILEHRCCCTAVSSNFTSNTKRSGKNPGACGGCKKDAQVLERQKSTSRLLASLLLGITDPSDPEKSFARPCWVRKCARCGLSRLLRCWPVLSS